MDLTIIEEHLKSGARLILLCSPHNPVSRLWSEQELDALFALAIQYDAIVVSDEIHADFVYAPGKFVSALKKPEWSAHVVALLAGSKTFNIAGLKQSLMVCREPKTREKLLNWVQNAGIDCGNLFALEANKAAYTLCDDWLDGLLEYLDGNRDIISTTLADRLPKAVVTPIEATLAWWMCVPASMDNEAIIQHCLDAGVAQRWQQFRQESGRGFLRINFGCPRSQLNEGLASLGCRCFRYGLTGGTNEGFG